MTAQSLSNSAKYCGVFLCALVALAGTPSLAQETAGAAKADRQATADDKNAALAQIYFGAPILPSRFVVAPERKVPPVKAADEHKVAKQHMDERKAAKRSVNERSVAKRHVKSSPQRVVRAAPRAAKRKPSSVALYKEAVRANGVAFANEPAIRWRKCIPGFRMPIVCYLPARERLSIIVRPAQE